MTDAAAAVALSLSGTMMGRLLAFSREAPKKAVGEKVGDRWHDAMQLADSVQISRLQLR
jgi:hypothetical protein